VPSTAPLIDVIVCDDNHIMRSLLSEVLLGYGLRVHGVASAEALDQQLADKHVDLVLLDVGLPDEDGLSVAARLRLAHPHLGIVMLTARDEEPGRTRAMAQGADHYFVKPFDTAELAAALIGLHARRSH
jgi:DNA-binding response OmpR family regulator